MTDLSTLKDVAAIASSATIVVGAVGAVIKYRLLNFFGHKWESSLATTDQLLDGGTHLFLAEYAVANNGQRPLRIEGVSLSLMGARREAQSVLLQPDQAAVFACRNVPDGVGTPGNLDVQPGERSIFTLRCEVGELPELSFVECTLRFRHKRLPAIFVGLHRRSRAA